MFRGRNVMTRAQRLLIAAAVAGASALGSFSANAFWGSGPFGMFPGNWDGPGWGNWGSPWYGGYPYGGYGYPYGGYGYPYGGYGYPYGGYGYPFAGYGYPAAWGAPVYGYPAVAAPVASQTTSKASK
jgi:hypothetical protein